MPDAPADDLVIVGSKLVLGTNVGAFVADRATLSSWSQLGSGLPNAALNDLTTSPSGSYVVAVTHGRGLRKITTP